MNTRSDRWLRWLKPLLFAACAWPFILLAHGAVTDGLGANPLERVTHVTGDWTLRLLLLTLAMTPLRRLSGWRWPLRVRRMLGLFVFFYASVHFLAWAWLDQQWQLGPMLADIVERPYITVGFLGWLLLLPLALTSNHWSMRRLGRRWSLLHRLVYPIGLLGVLHFLWLIKADWLEPVVYGVILLGLLLLRVEPVRHKAQHFVARWGVSN